jgi:YD repeat-containing protein
VATETFQYDLERHVILYTDRRQNHWGTSYDGFGRVAETVDPLGDRSHTT